ncbi:MAG: response regulator [Pseudomonadota bacterium]
MRTRILVVDDDPRIQRLLDRFLTREGFAVTTAGSIKAAREALDQESIVLVLLDLNLGAEDGLTLARLLGGRRNLGLIIVSGKTSTVDRIVGLEIGADDYVSKPFDLRELLARMRAVLRRLSEAEGTLSVDQETGTPKGGRTQYHFGHWRFDTDRRTIESADGAESHLTTAEYNLLLTFVRHPRKVLNRDQLMDEVAGRAWTPFDRAIDTQVRRLRVKLGDAGRTPRLIQTVRGAGYVFSSDVKIKQ